MAVAEIRLPAFLTRTPTGFRTSVTLSSVIYRVRFTWDNRANADEGAWRLDFNTADGTPVILGRKLVLTDDVFALDHYREFVPPGRLQVRRRDGSEVDPGLYDLGGAVALEYVT